MARKSVNPCMSFTYPSDEMNQLKYQALLLGTDPKLAEAVALVLRLDGASISFAGNYADALRVLQTQPPDLVLVDLRSAETDSLNLLRQIRHYPPPTPMFTVGVRARRREFARPPRVRPRAE